MYEAWASAFENYRQQFIELDTEYYAIGSGEALRRASQGIHHNNSFAGTEFYATDLVFTASSDTSWSIRQRQGDVTLLPVLGGFVYD